MFTKWGGYTVSGVFTWTNLPSWEQLNSTWSVIHRLVMVTYSHHNHQNKNKCPRSMVWVLEVQPGLVVVVWQQLYWCYYCCETHQAVVALVVVASVVALVVPCQVGNRGEVQVDQAGAYHSFLLRNQDLPCGYTSWDCCADEGQAKIIVVMTMNNQWTEAKPARFLVMQLQIFNDYHYSFL